MRLQSNDGWLRGSAVVASAVLTASVVMLVLDLVFLGIVAKPFYDTALGSLRSEQVYWPAALAFYGFYVGAIVWVAVLPVRSVATAAARGSGLGLFAYGVYELTNWAVIADWPGHLVPVDVAWGVVLTGTVAAASYRVSALIRPTDADDWMHPFEIRTMVGESLAAVWARRIASVPIVLLLALVAWGLAPLWLAIAAFADLALGPRWKWARLRGTAFFMLYLACESWGIATAAMIWILTLGGRIVSQQCYMRYNATLQRWWSAALLKGSFLVFSMRLEVQGQEAAREGPFFLLVRHVSAADTVLAANIIASRYDILLQYVIKTELLWVPCLDIVGRRLPNAFIDRSGGDARTALDAISDLARNLDARSAVLIYPEGTRFSAIKRARFIERLRERGKGELATMAEGMMHVLAPRTGGVSALLDVAPEVDVVVLAHVGFEGARSFSAFVGGQLVGRTVSVKLWRVPATEIPAQEREPWLFDLWAEVDAWVTSSKT